MVILRNKGGEIAVRDRAGLLAFLRGELGMGKDEGGIRNVESGLEVIAAAPFVLALQTGDVQDTASGVAWTFSTFDLDRFDERIDPAGWDYKQFMQNPVIQWAHKYDIPAIGRADGLYADGKGLHGSIIFNDRDYDAFGWGIGERVKAGVIRAGSVGFRVLEIEIPSKKDAEDGTTLIFRKQELLEFSVCNVPANPWALAKAALAKASPAEGGPVALDLQASRQFLGGLIQG
ncbi:putative caudovirus prohead protease [Treponema primitia ZAS-2]|uniref:Putative caudovirus prohead protease n=1 Tax=Treponema primitia (strain ATCC BAA-887 / DSM 12427 / ZAS-2) TaxID=545694 RepID=F5YJW4_TREPZ|nr:HK97 family phage prohead protease [Treponema primitia]AEF86331.1 putative caudovirus prohead protease [Treponema primitia ZAS-2]